jgi:hypothetical protein
LPLHIPYKVTEEHTALPYISFGDPPVIPSKSRGTIFPLLIYFPLFLPLIFLRFPPLLSFSVSPSLPFLIFLSVTLNFYPSFFHSFTLFLLFPSFLSSFFQQAATPCPTE